MEFQKTPLAGNYLINLNKNEDERGFFARYFCQREFEAVGLNTEWSQINNSMSRERGTLRGLHAQAQPHAETKLVRCISGAIWDVVVDLRSTSSSFGVWHAAELSAQNRTMMYVPEGYAHGFITLTPDAEIIYLVSKPYHPSAEITLLWNDQDVAIMWPIEPIIISEKDRVGENLKELKGRI